MPLAAVSLRLTPAAGPGRLLALGLALGLGLMGPTCQAAESVVFVSGAFRRSIPVADVAHLAETGQAVGLLADALALTNQNPAEVAKLLNQSIKLPLPWVSRLLQSRIGEVLLSKLASMMFPLNAPAAGVPALRAAIVLGAEEGRNGLNAISFLRAYPNRELAISLPILMGLMRKGSSITDLVRFFADSPLDGLRGPTPPAAGSDPGR